VGDRTKIADALDVIAADRAAKRMRSQPDALDLAAARNTLAALDAAGYDVVLRADPDTSDDLLTEARRLLDAATPGPWEQWEAYEVRSFGPTLIASTNGRTDNSQAVADVELIAAAPRLIAALLERAVTAEADLRALSTRTTGDSKVDLRMLYAYEAGIMERDAERAARERAEAEARQLREAIATEGYTAEPLRSHVVKALQDAWDNYVGDTHCYPDDFRIEGRTLYAEFGPGNFTVYVANFLGAALLAGVAEGAEDREEDE
jgi:hypothetical protein